MTPEMLNYGVRRLMLIRNFRRRMDPFFNAQRCNRDEHASKTISRCVISYFIRRYDLLCIDYDTV